MDKLLLYVSKNEKILQKKNDGITVYNAVITPEKKETRSNIFTGDNEYILQQIVENKLVFDEIIIDNYEDISTECGNYVYAYIKCLNKTGIFTVNNLSSAYFIQYSDLYTLKEDGHNIVIKHLEKEEKSKNIEVINFAYKYKALANKACMDIDALLSEVKEQKIYITELEEQCIKFDKWYKDLEKGAQSTYEELQKSQAYIKDLENICKVNEENQQQYQNYVSELENICKTNEEQREQQQKYVNELENICKTNEEQREQQQKYVNELENICKTNEEQKEQQQKYINELENICKTNEEQREQQQKYIKELEDSIKNVYNQQEEKSKYINELENTCKEQEQIIQYKDDYINKIKESHENEITQLVDENIRKIESTNKIHEDAVKKLLKIENSIWYKMFNKFYKY